MTDRVSEAWRRAATDLGIDIVAPFVAIDGATGAQVRAIALVPAFGAPAGTLVIGSTAADPQCLAWAHSRGAFVSIVSEEAYADYERDLFVDTLDDWGWFGEAQGAPAWFTGRPWTRD